MSFEVGGLMCVGFKGFIGQSTHRPNLSVRMRTEHPIAAPLFSKTCTHSYRRLSSSTWAFQVSMTATSSSMVKTGMVLLWSAE